MDNLSSGNFLHHVMEVFLKETVDEEGQIRSMTEEELDSIADRIMTEYIYSLCGDIEGNGRLLHLFARLRSMTLVLVRSVQKELEQGSFLPIASEWDTHGRRPGDPQPMVIPLDLPEDPLPLSQGGHQTVNILMGGKIDRVDVFRDGNIAYIRVIDYKSSCHIFSEKKMFEDMNVQLLLYLFTLCAPRNRGLFADKEGTLPTAVLPAEVLYLSPTESAADGSMSPVRSGMILNEENVLRAASATLDTEFLPGVKRDSKTGDLKGAALCSTEHMTLLDQEIQSAIREVAHAIYQGTATRTPGQEACRFCAVRTSCPLAECTDR
jgi:ATP-dependent helicase/nuclease subunit B